MVVDSGEHNRKVGIFRKIQLGHNTISNTTLKIAMNAGDVLTSKFADLETYIKECRKDRDVDGIVISVDPTKHTASGRLRLGKSLFDVNNHVLDHITNILHEIAGRFDLQMRESVFTERGQIGDFKAMIKMPMFRNWIFIFNDNVLETGVGGNAAIRHKTQTLRYGIPTGWAPGDRRMGFVSLEDTADRVKHVRRLKKRPRMSTIDSTSGVVTPSASSENIKRLNTTEY